MSQLKKRLNSPAASLRTLLDKGMLEERFVQEDRPLLDQRKAMARPALPPAQQAAFDGINTAWNTTPVVLLEGVTSSGKRRCIFLIEEQLAQEKQVLFYCPRFP